MTAQIAKTLGSTSIRRLSDTLAWERCRYRSVGLCYLGGVTYRVTIAIIASLATFMAVARQAANWCVLGGGEDFQNQSPHGQTNTLIYFLSWNKKKIARTNVTRLSSVRSFRWAEWMVLSVNGPKPSQSIWETNLIIGLGITNKIGYIYTHIYLYTYIFTFTKIIIYLCIFKQEFLPFAFSVFLIRIEWGGFFRDFPAQNQNDVINVDDRLKNFFRH